MASSDEESVNSKLRQRQQSAIGVLWPANCDERSQPVVGIGSVRPFLRSLRSTIHREIIPRLVLAHARPGSAGVALSAVAAMSAQDVLECVENTADCAAAQDSRGLRECLDLALDWGMALEQVYIQILGGAACALGERWGRDTLNFVEVVIGMGVLQSSLRELAQDHQHEAAGLASARRVMLAPTPGECHSFGSSVVAEVFRHRGWNVESEFNLGCNEISGILRGEWFDVVGLSLGSDRNLQQLSETIRQIRRHSRNRRVGILVGGPAFTNHPERLTSCGGDACSTDAVNAVEQASLLLGLLAESPG